MYFPRNKWSLFDLKTDPHEMKSVHAEREYLKVRRELTEEFHRLREHFGARRALQNDAYEKFAGNLHGGIRLTAMMKTLCMVALLWAVNAPAQDVGQSKANHKYLKAFPKAAEDMSRFVIVLPDKTRGQEGAFKVELIVGRMMDTDGVNRMYLGGKLEPKPLKGGASPTTKRSSVRRPPRSSACRRARRRCTSSCKGRAN